MLAIVVLFVAVARYATAIAPEHVVAVMFENRAFDHALGHLKQFDSRINGLTGQESNPLDPAEPSKGSQRVSFDAPDKIMINPGHSVDSTRIEVWGSDKRKSHPPMNGFISEMMRDKGMTMDVARTVMRCYNHTSAGIMSTLAREYAVFDGWFSSVPGPTMINRLFALSGTSYGMAANNFKTEYLRGFPQPSIFGDMHHGGVDSQIYFSDFPTPLMFDDVSRLSLETVRPIQDFTERAKHGSLPAFSWVEPRFFALGPWDETDQHPQVSGSITGDGSYAAGEKFLRYVYETLRASPKWNTTALLIYYDEHGGTYDHVPPPQNGVPNPDGRVSKDPAFAFDRLGVRVPAVLVSPLVERGSIVRAAPGKYFDHTSLLKTLRKIFPKTRQDPLARERWVDEWSHAFSGRRSKLDASPHTLAGVGAFSESEYAEYVKQLESDDGSMAALRNAEKSEPERVQAQGEAEPTDLQVEMLHMAVARAAPADREAATNELPRALSNIADAARYMRRRMTALMSQSNDNSIDNGSNSSSNNNNNNNNNSNNKQPRRPKVNVDAGKRDTNNTPEPPIAPLTIVAVVAVILLATALACVVTRWFNRRPYESI